MTEVMKHLPKVDGKKANVCTLLRWCRRSLWGVSIKCARVDSVLLRYRSIVSSRISRVLTLAGHSFPFRASFILLPLRTESQLLSFQ
jgi:hypothetical protein